MFGWTLAGLDAVDWRALGFEVAEWLGRASVA